MTNKEYSIEDLRQEFAAAPVRKSLATGRPVPADGWWFPAFVPGWARMLPRELYEAAYYASSASWELSYAAKRLGKLKPGRPRQTDNDEDLSFFLKVESIRGVLEVDGKRPSVLAALKSMTGKRNVGAERARYMRIRKLYKSRSK